MMKNLLIGLILVSALAGTGSSSKPGETWPAFRGNGDSHTEAHGLPLHWSDQNNVAWKTDLPGYGQSSPVVWRDKVFLTAITGAEKEKLHVVCLDLKSGRTLWQNESSATDVIKDSPTVSKAAPTAVVDADRVYAFFESGDVLAFNHQGKPVWQRKLSEYYGHYKGNHGLGSSLAITDNAVLVLVAHDGPSFLVALDKRTGKNLWKTDRDSGVGWGSPILTTTGQDAQVLVSVSSVVSAYHSQTGKLLWSLKGIKANNIPSPTVGEGMLFIGSSEKGHNLAIKPDANGMVAETNILWRAAEATASFSSPLIHQGHVYFVNKVGVAFCLDAKTGEERWRHRLGGECWTSPTAVGERIYFFVNTGKTFVVRSGSQLEVLAENTLSDVERVYGIAAVNNSFLLRLGRKLIKLSETQPTNKEKKS